MKRLFLLVLVTVAAGLLAPLSVWITKVLIDLLAAGPLASGTAAEVYGLIAALGCVAAALAVLPLLAGHLTEELARNLNYRADELLTEKLNHFVGLAPFEDPALHDRLRLAQQGAESGPPVLISSAVSLVRQTLTLGGFLAAAAAVSLPIAAVVLIATAPALVAERAFARRRVRLAFQLTAGERRRLFFHALQTDTAAAKELRLFGAGSFIRQRLLSEHALLNAQERELAGRITRGRSWLALIGAMGAASALALAAQGAVAGALTIGDVTVALAAVPGVQIAALGLIEGVSRATTAAMTFGFLVEVLDTDDDVRVPDRPQVLPTLRQGIEFRDVWFRYSEDADWVLRGLTLRMPAHKTLALVGPNGAGKSTIIKLLARFYDPDRGTITWDGTDIRCFDVNELRQRLTSVFQDYVAYDLTAAENIALAETGAPETREQIRAAAEAAGLDDVLRALPHGYDTMLSRSFEGLTSEHVGVELSGGQWQRIALARMYLRVRAEVFLLDEPTAALDVEAESRLFQHFTDLMAGRTNIIISHRMASTRSADVVAVLEEGRVVELGTPDDLLQAGGFYARYHRLQDRLGTHAV